MNVNDPMTLAVVGIAGYWGYKKYLEPLRLKARQLDELHQGEALRPEVIGGEFRPFTPSLSPPPSVAGGGMGRVLMMITCAIYIISPIDFVPDFIPVLGWGDDVMAAVIGLRAMLAKK